MSQRRQRLIAQNQTTHPQIVPVDWRSLYYSPFQLRFRFPYLAARAIRGWIILLLCLPLLIRELAAQHATSLPPF